MLILSMDTSGDICSVGVSDGPRELTTFAFRHDRHLSERLPGIVEFVLRDRGITLADIEAFATGLGPGSFTGVRVGVTFTKTLAYASRRPLIGVSSLDALAEGVVALPGLGVAAVAPTRHVEVVAAYYQAGQCTPVAAPAVVRNDTVLAQARAALGLAPDAALLVIGEAADAVERDSEISATTGALFRSAAVSASVIGRIAAGRIARGEFDDVYTLTPLYVTPTPVG